MNFIPNIPPKTFTLSAVIVGYLLIDDATASEQNALGNWLMLVAQVLCTNAYYKELQTERGINNSEPSTKDTISMIEKMVFAMQEEINELKKSL